MRCRVSVLAALVGIVCFTGRASAQVPGTGTLAPVDLSLPLTLDRAIKIALQYQGTLGIARSSISAANARVTQAKASFYPSIAPTFQYNNQLTTQTVNGKSVTGTFESHNTQIGLNQLIFDSGKREENVLVSRYSAKATSLSYLDSRQSVIDNVTTTYYELLRQRELVRVAQSNLARAKTTLDFTTASAEVGSGAKKDVYQAQADYGNAEVQVIVAQNNVKIAASQLKSAMGVLSMAPLDVPDVKLAPPPSKPDTRTSNDYLAQALDRRFDLKADAENINASRHSVKVANIGAGLVLTASIQEGYRVNPNPGEQRAFVTNITYPLFDAGLSRATVLEAKAALQQSKEQLKLGRDAVQLDVEQSLLNREAARQSVNAAQNARAAAQINYDAAQASLKEGAGTIIDVITAQNALVTAETNLVQAVYDFYTNDAHLKRAIGDNDPYLVGGT